MLLASLFFLLAVDAPAAPAQITDAQRAAYWQALAELNAAQAVFQQRISEMRDVCSASGSQLGQGTDRQPQCLPAAKPEPKK